MYVDIPISLNLCCERAPKCCEKYEWFIFFDEWDNTKEV